MSSPTTGPDGDVLVLGADLAGAGPADLLIRDGRCSGGADPQRDGMAMSA